MPRGANLSGKVILYTSTLRNVYNISGDQVGAYFGYSLTTSDVDGDGYVSLYVGLELA